MGTGVKQKAVVMVQFSPNIGHEQAGLRPAIVVSGNAFHVSGLCFVCPLTTVIKNYPCDPILEPTPQNGLNKSSEILIGQFKTIDQSRIQHQIGTITNKQLAKIFEGLDALLDR